MMHAVTKLRTHGILWPYKSQRKATNQEAGKHEKNGGERKKGGGRKTQTVGDMEAEKPEAY
jgi:hypothetical protein